MTPASLSNDTFVAKKVLFQKGPVGNFYGDKIMQILMQCFWNFNKKSRYLGN